MVPLTSREVEVARLVAKGHSNEEIGHKLKIALQTVKNHIRSVFRKLSIANRVELSLRFGKVRHATTFRHHTKNRQTAKRKSA